MYRFLTRDISTAMSGALVRDSSSLSLAEEPGPPSFDLDRFSSYVLKLAPLLLDADDSDLHQLIASVNYSHTATRWASDASSSVVYLSKLLLPPPDEDRTSPIVHCHADSDPEELLLPPIHEYHLTTNLSYSTNQVATLALIKHSTTLDTALPLSSQLHFLNLFGPASSNAGAGAAAGAGVYEGLHRLVHYGVAPAFEAFVESRGKVDSGKRRDEGKEADGKLGIPMTKKKFAELELSLLHCTSGFRSSS